MPKAVTKFQRKLFAEFAKEATRLLAKNGQPESRLARATNREFEEQVIIIDDSLGVSPDGERFWVLTEQAQTVHQVSELDPVCLRYFLAALFDTAVV